MSDQITLWCFCQKIVMKEKKKRGIAVGLSGVVALGLLLLAACLFIYDMKVTTRATGVIEPAVAATLYAPLEGRGAEVMVLPGSEVVAGDGVLRLENPEIDEAVLAAKQDIEGFVHEIRQSEIKLRELEITEGIPESFAVEQSLALQREIESEYESIRKIYSEALDSGGVSKLKATEKVIEALKVRMEGFSREGILHQKESGLTDVYTDREREWQRFARAQIELLNDRLSLLRSEQALLEIRAPISGIVTDVYAHHRYARVSGGDALLGIADLSGEYEVEAYIPDRNIDLVHEGLEVRLESHVYQSSSEGYMTGRVSRVIRDAYRVSPDSEAQFEILVTIDSFPVEPVVGSKVDLEIMVHDLTPIDLVARRSLRTRDVEEAEAR